MKVVYQGNDIVKTVKLHTLRSSFETIKMSDIKNLDQFMSRVARIVNQVKLIGETIIDQKIVKKNILFIIKYKFIRLIITFLG